METEQEILTRFGITTAGEHAYAVPSSNGKGTYTVRYAGRGDCAEVRLWECDCPAGQHGKTCKHIRLVGEANGAICDELGCE
jgi:hypothetical protein